VLEAAAGRRHELKEYVTGVQVFGKEDTFDPRTDPIVRVQGRRLRAKLVRYYREEGRADETVIELPKGGYAPVFKQRDTPMLIKRSVAAALVSRNTVAVLPYEAAGLQILELVQTAYSSDVAKNSHEQARLIKTLVSNSAFDRGSLSPTYVKPFDVFAKGSETGDWLLR
jgi:hypothetical protein